jgi:uncharacterized protein (DUF427 family)
MMISRSIRSGTHNSRPFAHSVTCCRMVARHNKDAQPSVAHRWNHRARRTVGIGMAAGHKITIAPAARHVVVTLGGEKLAESDRPVLLDETGLPTRYYLPREDVRTELLRPTDSVTTCPFKGQASYWSVQVGGEIHDDLVWSYQTPIPAAAEIAGLMCFYAERVDFTVDGQRQPRPQTLFSR